MSEKYKDQQADRLVYFKSKKGTIIEIGEGLLELIEYEKTEIVGRDTNYFLNHLLRLNADIDELGRKQESHFIFTKKLEPREVDMTTYSEEDTITFIISEKPYSRLEGKFSYLEYPYKTGRSGIAIWSSKDLKLLKANNTYIEYLNAPFNKREHCIGKKINEIVKGYKGSIAEEIWTKLSSKGEAHYADEVMYEGYDRGITYWDSSIVPVHENGAVKYFVENAIEVTERVLSRNKIEEQAELLKAKNEELQAIIDAISDDLYMIEKDETIRPLNSSAEMSLKARTANIKDNYKISKYYDLLGNKIPFKEMPCVTLLRGGTVKGEVLHIKQGSKERYVSVTGVPIFDENNKVKKAICCHQDISKYIMQSQIITQQKDQLEAIIENMSDGLFMLDQKKHFIFLNEAGKAFFYESDKVVKNGDSFKHTKYY